jgi:predicted CopG family antitoxin
MHIHTQMTLMSTRTISITDEAYLKLKSLKASEKESFSDVILRYYPSRKKTLGCFG